MVNAWALDRAIGWIDAPSTVYHLYTGGGHRACGDTRLPQIPDAFPIDLHSSFQWRRDYCHSCLATLNWLSSFHGSPDV